MLLNRYGLSEGYEVLISSSLLKHKEKYQLELMKAIRTGSTEDWILFMLQTIREGAQETISLIFSVHELREEVADRCEGLTFVNNEMLDVLFSNAYCKSVNLVQANIAERVTSMKYLKLLEERGVLESEKVGRELVFKNVVLFKLIMGC